MLIVAFVTPKTNNVRMISDAAQRQQKHVEYKTAQFKFAMFESENG